MMILEITHTKKNINFNRAVIERKLSEKYVSAAKLVLHNSIQKQEKKEKRSE